MEELELVHESCCPRQDSIAGSPSFRVKDEDGDESDKWQILTKVLCFSNTYQRVYTALLGLFIFSTLERTNFLPLHFFSLLLVLLADSPLHRRPGRNTVDPLQQVRKWLHVVL